MSSAYVSTLDTPENKAFNDGLRAKFGDEMLTPSDFSVPLYDAIPLYKLAAEKAGTFDTEAVTAALGEVTFVGPRGLFTMNAQHHTRGGRTLPFVVPKESLSVPIMEKRIRLDSIIHADAAYGWDPPHLFYEVMRINHQEAYSHDGALTNQAESFFSRIRRAEIGMHHHIAGPYLESYALEMAWREDTRKINNGEQFLLVILASLSHPVSRAWKGYWERRKVASLVRRRRPRSDFLPRNVVGRHVDRLPQLAIFIRSGYY